MRYLILLAVAFVLSVSASLSCLNDKGQPVDWFVAIKVPIIQEATDPAVRHGLALVYIDSASGYERTWKLTGKNVQTDATFLSNTIGQIKQNLGDVAYIQYDDQRPDGHKSQSNGHTKGVTATDSKQGFWLIHSVPGWPETPENWSLDGPYYPSNQAIYGQSFLCVTLPEGDFDDIGSQLKITHPQIVAYGVPSSFNMPNFEAAAKGDFIGRVAASNIHDFKTVGGITFHHFAKNGPYNNDIWETLVSPKLGTDLMCETWMRPKMDSFCKPTYDYNNMNIMTVDLGNGGGSDNKDGLLAWGYTNDHSKWCIATDGGNAGHWVCIGDMNRMQSQFGRGGGAMCFEIPNVYDAFNKIVIDVESC